MIGELSCCGGGGDYEANQVPFKNRTCFTYHVSSNVCLPVIHRTHSGFSKYRNPSSVWSSGGIRMECATLVNSLTPNSAHVHQLF
jgi:hypothetical protein